MQHLRKISADGTFTYKGLTFSSRHLKERIGKNIDIIPLVSPYELEIYDVDSLRYLGIAREIHADLAENKGKFGQGQNSEYFRRLGSEYRKPKQIRPRTIEPPVTVEITGDRRKQIIYGALMYILAEVECSVPMPLGFNATAEEIQQIAEEFEQQ